MTTYQEWLIDQENTARLKAAVDRLSDDLLSGRLESESELDERVQGLRELCRELFPDRLDLFEMIYAGRFRRLWSQFRGPLASDL